MAGGDEGPQRTPPGAAAGGSASTPSVCVAAGTTSSCSLGGSARACREGVGVHAGLLLLSCHDYDEMLLIISKDIIIIV